MKPGDLYVGQRFGELILVEPLTGSKWRCLCSCGNESTPTAYNLIHGFSKSCGHCGKNIYAYLGDGTTIEVTSTNGVRFLVDKEDENLARTRVWHVCADEFGFLTVLSSDRVRLHQLIMNAPVGYEVDHINHDRLDNRRENLRIVTHQQNQMNQPLQKNNTSGVSGVSYYPAREKYRARIKICQHEIHLGYYSTFLEAVQARNYGMECMFGEYGYYNNVPPTPQWIKKKVIEQCERFAELSVCRAFLISQVKEVYADG